MAIKTKYEMTVEEEELKSYLSVVKNKIYKLLPLREEGLEWERFLHSLLVELSGCNSLFNNKVELITILSKLEALYALEDFMIYRKIIFECLSGIDDLR